ncbi:hypothetical protein HET16_001751, partial [Campylobacter coli]|nr:hypothetical protein [Campylobacter coli]EBF6072597.1 hypothetical protein [Campylobacter coli]EDO9153845.1 hypothetical protein [Campylobacter coli]EEU4948909.1 hypothetical protein [Campylobacter coli]EGM0200754.1 hypothetical protein [Campylobacter coli]
MILVTPCGVIDTTNFGKSEVNRQTIDFSLKSQEKKEKIEAEAKKEEQSNSTNADNQANTS